MKKEPVSKPSAATVRIIQAALDGDGGITSARPGPSRRAYRQTGKAYQKRTTFDGLGWFFVSLWLLRQNHANTLDKPMFSRDSAFLRGRNSGGENGLVFDYKSDALPTELSRRMPVQPSSMPHPGPDFNFIAPKALRASRGEIRPAAARPPGAAALPRGCSAKAPPARL